MEVEVHAKAIFQEIADSWQCRALKKTRFSDIGPVVLSVLAHSYDEAMEILLRVAFPGFTTITAPFICSTAKVDKTGAIVADMATQRGTVDKDVAIFHSLEHMQGTFRKLADELKLNDDERKSLFTAARNWVVADRRLDPTMNPLDPDAKRLTTH